MGEQRIVRRLPSWSALAGAVLFYCLSFTPSLLPRPWILQAAAGAITAFFGYGFGAFFGLVADQCGLRPPPNVRRAGWWLLAGAGGGAVVAITAWSVRWQGDVRRAVGLDPRIGWWQWALVLPVAALLGGLLVLAARGVRLGTRTLRRILGRAVPGCAAAAGAAALAAVLVVGFVEGFLLRGLLGLAERGAALTDRSTSPGTVRPELPTLSGSPASYESWDSLGAKGRDFVGRAPTAAQISAFTGRPAKDPVRAYVGLRSGAGIGLVDPAHVLQDRARRAVAELDRAGGFRRKVLVVIGTTGSGWVNERIAQPPEYLYDGDSAEVAYQYSYLPSWISFLTEGEATEPGGRCTTQSTPTGRNCPPRAARGCWWPARASAPTPPNAPSPTASASSPRRPAGRCWSDPPPTTRCARPSPHSAPPAAPSGGPSTRTAAPSASPSRPPTSGCPTRPGPSPASSTCRTAATPWSGGSPP
ncbi:hypothetical protein KCH_73630 [Kitasatospora cheerisanensis KCTC 2395]|uniref:Uncharacterized protein n=1 Tax=Kitasatospora cheerisanensis KCTC 2395 TaxID=1348663 RepID=A0A066YHA4_9ACTN|nr:hypothetical protein KCH_73630 [Kitasatospora cheerisanensis KCTC 2395]